MREILFRGKSPITKEWVYGDLFQHGEQRFIMTGGHNIEVDPESVGQFTGLTDKYGTKIFEGDIVKIYDSYDLLHYDNPDYQVSKVFYSDGALCVDYHTSDYDYTVMGWMKDVEFEVVGNIHDNPELIEDMDIKPAAKRGDAPAEQLALAPAT